MSRSEGQDRVQPANARVAPDDIRGRADGGRTRITAGCRQPTCDRHLARARVETQDVIELADTVTAPEEVDEAAESDGRSVVLDCGERPSVALCPASDDVDPARGGVLRREPPGEHHALAQRRRAGVLDRCGKAACRAFGQPHAARPPPRRPTWRPRVRRVRTRGRRRRSRAARKRDRAVTFVASSKHRAACDSRREQEACGEPAHSHAPRAHARDIRQRAGARSCAMGPSGAGAAWR